MKVYRIEPDVSYFQWFLPSDKAFWEKSLMFDCTAMKDVWTPPTVYCSSPLKKRGHFPNFSAGTLLVTAEAMKNSILPMHLEMAGELLSVYHEEENEYFNLLNVTECINPLDKKRTEWLLNSKGEKVLIQKYSFHSDRFGESSIFKIPETLRAEVLTYERSGDPEEEFKACVETSGLKGLTFEELWDSESIQTIKGK